MCCSSCRTVIWLPSLPLPRTTPGSHCSTVSSRDIRPSPTSCSTTVAVKVLVALPIRNLPSRGIGLLVFIAAVPAYALSRASSDVTSACTPTAPVSWIASTCRWSGSAGRGFAAAVGAVDAARTAVARLVRTSVPRRRLLNPCMTTPSLFRLRPSSGTAQAVARDCVAPEAGGRRPSHQRRGDRPIRLSP